MRDLLIMSIVILGSAAALRRPWIGVMLWTWLSIMNPHRFAWGFAYSAPVAAMAAGSTLLGMIFTRDKEWPFKGPAVWWLFIFTIWVTISWQMGFDSAAEYDMWDRVMKIYLMTFVALSLLKSKQQILAFAFITIASLGILASKGGLFTILTAGNYRVYGPPESFIEDNNDFALATVVAIPMLYFLQLQLRQRWMRHMMTVVILLCAASVLGSQSRGGLLAICAMGAIFWLRGSNKVAIGLGLLVVVLIGLPMMPEAWWDRMATIGNYTEDASAMGRINAWNVAVSVAKHNFFGGGMSYQYPEIFEQYGVYETTVRAAHSIYFQILGNHGFVGLFLFLMIWLSAYRSASWLRKNASDQPDTMWAGQLGAMVQTSLIGYAVGGAFLSLQYFDLPYNLMVMVVLAKKWVQNRAWETEQGTLYIFRKIGFGDRDIEDDQEVEPSGQRTRAGRARTRKHQSRNKTSGVAAD